MTKFEARKARIMAMLGHPEPSQKRDGKKKQRSRRVKLDRFQHNLTNGQTCKARSTFNYFPGGLFDRPDMFIG